MSAWLPARTVAVSGTAIGPVTVDVGTRNTVTVPCTVAPAPSVTVTVAVPIRAGCPSAVVPLTRTRDCATTLTLRFGSDEVASEMISTRPEVFCTAARTSTVVSSLARTKAVIGAIDRGVPDPTTVTRRIADCWARVCRSCTV